MNTANFSEYLQNPSLLHQISYEELKTLIVQYPYSQNLRYLIAQKSNMENNENYEHFLRSAAIISTDRAHLYHILKLQKAEPAVEDSFILEEETLELKNLNQLDLNEVMLEPIEASAPEERLDLNGLDRQEAIFDTFPELSPDANSDAEDLPSLATFEEDIALPTLEEESLEELVEDASSISDETTEENAIEALIDDTATESVATLTTATSIAALLEEEPIEEVETPEELRLEDLFETEISEEVIESDDEEGIDEKELAAEPEPIKFTPPPPVTSIQDLLGGVPKAKPRRPKRRMLKTPQPVPVAPSHFHQAPVKEALVEQKGEEIALNLKRKEEQVEQFASKSIEESVDIASETYANLLIRQNQHEKAIQVYERLKLIFPEKSAFFAEQIENLRQKL